MYLKKTHQKRYFLFQIMPPGKNKESKKVRPSRRSTPKNKQLLKIPWAPGFKYPSERDRFRAIGSEERSLQLCKEYLPGMHFKPVSEPVDKKDWLANQNEDGQSYFQFIGTCPWLQKGKVKGYEDTHNSSEKNIKDKYPNGKIYIIQMLSECDINVYSAIDVECLRQYTETYYGITTVLLPSLYLKKSESGTFIISHGLSERDKLNNENKGMDKPGPEFTIYPTYRQNRDGSKIQLRIDTGLSDLKRLMPRDGLFLVGVTMIDLYCDNTDLFTIGIGSCKDRLGIFSFLRYDPFFKQLSEEYWHEYRIEDTGITLEQRARLVLQRSMKTLAHEVGHLFGIKHCIYYMCLMNGSGHLDEDFRQPIHLCPVDLHKVCSLTGTDVHKRYRDLLKLYQSKDMNIEASWVVNRLSWLKD